jgi:dTDP-4-dehydrorhamnose 3,5-epimerase
VKILEIKTLAIPDITVIRFARFRDHRGYFTEHFRRSDFLSRLPFYQNVDFSQANESYSQPGTVRGLHFQWNPFMGKLVRTLSGHMVDLVLDIRKGSPAFGRIIGYDMPAHPEDEFSEWIWVPPGFAHGNVFKEHTAIEYLCTGEYSPGCEAGISPFAQDIDWSLCDPGIRGEFEGIAAGAPLITEKDRNGYSLADWIGKPESDNFVFWGACCRP